MHPWWLVARKCPHVCKHIAALMGVLMGGQPSGLQIFDGISCRLCGSRENDSIHIVLRCQTLESVRNAHLDRLKDTMPQAMWIHFNRLSDAGKISFFTSAFYCDFTPEWKHMYIEVAKWFYCIYKRRYELYEALGN